MKKNKNKKPLFLFIGKNSEPIFSKKNKKLLSDPLDDNNPITVQVLGICSALAITVQLKPAIVMTLSVILLRLEFFHYQPLNLPFLLWPFQLQKVHL